MYALKGRASVGWMQRGFAKASPSWWLWNWLEYYQEPIFPTDDERVIVDELRRLDEVLNREG